MTTENSIEDNEYEELKPEKQVKEKIENHHFYYLIIN